MDLAAHVRGFAGAAGSTISPVGFSGTTEMKQSVDARALDCKRFPEIKFNIYPHLIAFDCLPSRYAISVKNDDIIALSL